MIVSIIKLVVIALSLLAAIRVDRKRASGEVVSLTKRLLTAVCVAVSFFLILGIPGLASVSPLILNTYGILPFILPIVSRSFVYHFAILLLNDKKWSVTLRGIAYEISCIFQIFRADVLLTSVILTVFTTINVRDISYNFFNWESYCEMEYRKSGRLASAFNYLTRNVFKGELEKPASILDGELDKIDKLITVELSKTSPDSTKVRDYVKFFGVRVAQIKKIRGRKWSREIAVA